MDVKCTQQDSSPPSISSSPVPNAHQTQPRHAPKVRHGAANWREYETGLRQAEALRLSVVALLGCELRA